MAVKIEYNEFGFEATVRKPLETGSRYEFPTGHINAYPIPQMDIINFDVSLDGCEAF